jgi:hypothetical protein
VAEHSAAAEVCVFFTAGPMIRLCEGGRGTVKDMKPLSGTNAKNGAITPSLTLLVPTLQAGVTNVHFCGPPKHKGTLFRPLVVTMQAGAGG